jgi:signal transduction histidine kinase
MMRGQLELQSQPGQGSTFSVTLTMEAPQAWLTI